MNVPKWITWWVLLSGLVVVWDAAFILLRPDSLPGGSLSQYFPGYALYTSVDTSYSDASNQELVGWALVNASVTAISWVALLLSLCGSAFGIVLLSASQLVVVIQTVLFLTIEAVQDFPHIGSATIEDFYMVYIVPNCLWIVVPFISFIRLALPIASALRRDSARKPKMS